MMILGALFGLLVGVGLLAAMRLVAPSLFPAQGGLHLGFYVGLLPTNPDGTFSRRDYWRMAGASLAGAARCLLLALVTMSLGALVSDSASIEQLTVAALFMLTLLMFLCVASALVHVWHALRWRPRRLASDWSPDDVEDPPE